MSSATSGPPAAGTPAGEDAAYPHWRRNTWVLAAGNVAYTCGFTVFYPYISLIVRELGVTEHLESWVGLIVGGMFLLTFLLTPVWGGLADHFGKKSMVLRAGLGIGITFVALGFAPGLGWFMALVYWLGVFNGFVAASMALVAGNTPAPRLGRALATVQGGAHLGGTLGPVVGAVLAAWLAAYQDLFYVSGVLGLGAGLLVLAFVHEARVSPAEPFRLHLLRDLARFLRLPNMGVLYLLNFIFASVFFGNVSVVGIYVLQLMGDAPRFHGLDPAGWVGAVNVALTVASIASLPVWGRVLDRFEPRSVLSLGLLLALLCTLPVPFLADPLQFTAARAVLGLLGSGIMPAVVRLIKERSPEGMDARALSFGTSLYMLGHGGAPVLAGIVGPLFGLRTYFALNSVLMLAGLGLWLASTARHRRPERG